MAASRRRWLLWALALSSLILLTYAGVLLAFSVRVPEDGLAPELAIERGSRAIVVPIASPAEVLVAGADTPGDIVATGDAGGSFPAGARDVSLARALAHVPEGANGTFAHGEKTLDLAHVSGGKEGWILLSDPAQGPWFAPADALLGKVARFEPPGRLGWLMASGAVGFVAPIVGIVLTHRPPAGTRPGVAVAVCRECRAPMPASAEFCMRCGAYRTREESPRA